MSQLPAEGGPPEMLSMSDYPREQDLDQREQDFKPQEQDSEPGEQDSHPQQVRGTLPLLLYIEILVIVSLSFCSFHIN